MADPENQTLRILRDIRTAMNAMDSRMGQIDGKMDDLRSRLDNIRQAITGESVLGRHAAARGRGATGVA
jgi:hypothetical protein